jgi:ABC-2 type transport system permease protein
VTTEAADHPAVRPVTGPAALTGDLRRFVLLTQRIAVLEFKLRFFGSALGYLWQFMRPLLLFGVLYVVFTEFVSFGNAPFYAVVLLMGIVLNTFLAESVSAAVSSVVDKENLVRKIHFPRLVIPVAVVLTALFSLALNLLVVLIFALAQGVPVRWSWLELPLLIAILVVLATGFAMLVSALFVRMRDIRPISDVALQIAFYSSPILYPLEVVQPAWIQKLILTVNPFADILQQARHAVIDPTAPSAAEAIGGWERLLIPGAIVAAVFAWGFWVFNRAAPRIAEDL